MSARVYAGAATPTTLSGSITNVSTSGTITIATNWLTSGQFSIVVDPGLAGEEKILCTLSGTTLTFITRGYDGTTAASHNSGAVVYPVPTAIDFSEANTHVNASSAVHGLAGSVVGTTDTQTLTNKDLSSSTNTFPASTPAGKNAVINGGMDIWQRGTTYTGTGGYQAPDRFYLSAAADTVFTRDTGLVPVGAKYSLKATIGATAAGPAIFYTLETANSLQFAGQSATLSVQLATSTSTSVQMQVAYSTSDDVATTGAWTLITNVNQTTTSSLTRYSMTVSIPSTARSLRIYLGTQFTMATAATINWGNIQLELGSTATTFSRAGGSIGGELALCQRYYYQIGGTTFALQDFGNGHYYSSGAAYILTTFPVPMRVAPTAACLNPTSFSVYSAGTGRAVTTFTIYSSSPFNATALFATAAATAGNGSWLEATNANATLTYSAEL